MPSPDPRTARRALGVLELLPLDAQADLAERIIDRLDTAGLDPNLEPDDHDACPAEDVPLPVNLGLGDADEAEDGGDDEPDDLDQDDVEVERFGVLRPERDGLVTVHRRPITAVLYRGGRPVQVESVWFKRMG